MKVRLLGYTAPTDEMSAEGLDTLQKVCAYCARVSNPKNQDNHATTSGLLNYLIKHAHWSPFEMVNVLLEIETTRDIARQVLRHRSFTFQEFSQRYADPSESLGFEHRECRMQDPANRQSSLWCSDQETKDWWDRVQVDIIHDCEDIYTQALRRGIAKEVARAVLPEGLMKSRLYMNGTLRSWIHYCELRTGIETQKEHRDLALECVEVISTIFPLLGERCG